MSERAMSQAALARFVGVDRSTISQVLDPSLARLPNAQVVGECAAALGVSSDWLLGLSDRPERAADLVAAAMTMTEAPRALVDERIFAWHQEAAGYKIRHDMLRWEYEPSLGRTTEQAIGASEDRLNWMRSARSDYEIALPLHELHALVASEGYYADLPDNVRDAQVAHLQALHDQLYPSLRIFLYDARKLYSAPITVFGPLLAVLYLGHNYLAFRDVERVDAIMRHFDTLVREAEVSARQFGRHIAGLVAGRRRR
jgi:transcriptional regulator with XRE-family HTH domain